MVIHVLLPGFRVLEVLNVPQFLRLLPGPIVEMALCTIVARILMGFGVAIHTRVGHNGTEIRLVVTIEAVYLAVLAVEWHWVNSELGFAPEFG